MDGGRQWGWRPQATRGTVGARPTERRCRPGPGWSCCIKARGAPSSALRAAGLAAGGWDSARDCRGPGGNSAGRAAQPRARSISPSLGDSPNSGGLDWLGVAGEPAGGRRRAPIRAGAGWRALLPASGRSRRVERRGFGYRTSPPPPQAPSIPPVPSGVQHLHRITGQVALGWTRVTPQIPTP